MNAPLVVFRENQERISGKKVQFANISAAKAVSDIIRTCLGPNAMLKMLLDPMGGIVLTNDGNCVLREIQVSHPAARSLIDISRTQDEEVGDGTTSVVVLAGEIMSICEPLLRRGLHPLHIISGLRKALEDILEVAPKLSVPIDVNDSQTIKNIINCCLGTKINHKWSDLVGNLAWTAINIVTETRGTKTISDFKRYARIEKIPGGHISDSYVLSGIILNKDVVHTGMSRRIVNPRIVLLDCSLEYKKGESQTNIELLNASDFDQALHVEEEAIKKMCNEVLSVHPNLVITEKGCSDLAQHYFQRAGVSVLRRVKKSDNNRIARATGAIILNRTEDITQEAVGTGAGFFEVRKIGDEYYSFLFECADPKACSIVLRGASKDILNEIERNLIDALNVARNVKMQPKIVPGGGAFEIALLHELEERAKKIDTLSKASYEASIRALEVIPRTLIQNAGGNPAKVLTELKVYSQKSTNFGIDGISGKICDMLSENIIDVLSVKTQVLKVAFEVCMMLLKIDDIVSGAKKTREQVPEITPVKSGPTKESED